MSYNLVFNRTAAARILQVSAGAIARFEVWASQVWVWVRGKRPTFLSKQAFKQDFAAYRQRGAQQCRVMAFWGCGAGQYQVMSQGSQRWHNVRLSRSLQYCDCPDYAHQQKEALGRGCCRHLYAVLGTLGHASLSDYLDSVTQPAVDVAALKAKYSYVSVE